MAVETTPVVVTNLPLSVRTIIGPEMVRVQRMPVDAVHPQAIRSIDQVVGKVARIAMTGDEPVLTTKVFLQRGESGLAFMVPEGMRAVSVNFNEVVGSGGMVTPGDHVDVIGVFETTRADVRAAMNQTQNPARATIPAVGNDPQASQNGSEDKISVATLVLQDVEVLAVAQRLEGEAPVEKSAPLPMLASGSNAKTGVAAQAERSEPVAQPQAKTATVAVNPEDALKLVLAEEEGTIRLALRRARDSERPEVAQMPMTALLAPAR
jgi:pilus assembly protein CpaB